MSQIAIVGGGIIGSSWALVFARAGFSVRVFARHAEVRATLLERVRQSAERAMAITPDVAVDDIIGRITVSATLDGAVRNAVWVQESVEENRDVKAAVFAAIDAVAMPNALLASSTSSIGASLFTQSLAGRGRCLVAHPATPPHLIPVVEIVPAPWTPKEVIDQAFSMMRRVGQVPVLVQREQPGFVLNRLQGALLIEMFNVISEGIMTPGDVDLLIKDGFGLRWAFLGPLEGIDLNAPGGIADYLGRYGFMFDQLARDHGASSGVVTSELIDVLHATMRTRVSLETLPERVAWRDRNISELRRLRRAAGAEADR
jgi:3-hydroxyacyl-CoA dehydrogenase